MIDFAAEHNILPDVEMIPIDYVNTAMERLLKSDVKYRFVIDIANSLKPEQLRLLYAFFSISRLSKQTRLCVLIEETTNVVSLFSLNDRLKTRNVACAARGLSLITVSVCYEQLDMWSMGHER